METKDKILAILTVALVFVFAFWSGGKYEQYKIKKSVTEIIDSFDEFMEGGTDGRQNQRGRVSVTG